MFPIVKKRVLNETVTLMEIQAPLVARKAQPGQFIIFRIDEEGERVPLTIADYDREKGTVTIIFQKVGYTTEKLDTLQEGDALLDFVGPLGEPSHTEGVRRAAVIGGGLGVAIAYPQAKALHQAGAQVDLIVGFRNQGLIILQEELTAACDDLTIMTDDGSNGHKGFVTQALAEKLQAGTQIRHGGGHWSYAHDESCLQPDPSLWHQNHCQHESHYDRRYRACAAAAGLPWVAKPSLPAWTGRTSTAIRWTGTRPWPAPACTVPRRPRPGKKDMCAA